jgi:hypothetical protein
MTLNEFSEITKQVIARDGLENYHPTVCYPARREIKVLTGVPPAVDLETAVLNWAAKSIQPNEEFLVAFRLDGTRFKIIRRVGPYSEDDIYSAGG